MHHFLIIACFLASAPFILKADSENECPKNMREWQALVDKIANQISPYDSTFAGKLIRTPKAQGYLETLDQCQSEWTRRRGQTGLKEIKACTQRIRSFLTTAQNFSPWKKDGKEGPARSLGFNESDPSYYAKVDEYVAIPEELTNQKFLQSISNPLKGDGVKNALRYIENLNQSRKANGLEEIVTFYFPTKLGNFEPSQRIGAWRLFVRWPGNPVRYIQFATHEKWGGSGQTSVVAVRTDKTGTLHTYIKDHWREILDEGDVQLPHVKEGIFKGNACITCHQSGPREIDPSSWSVLDKETKQKIKSINKEFSEMTGMRWGGFHDVGSMNLGPSMGELVPGQERNSKFFEACTKESFEMEKKYKNTGIPFEKLWENREQIYSKVKSAMNCASCHDGDYKGPIRIPFAYKHTFMKIYKGEMPPDNNLTEFERQLLVRCLEKEMFGYWLSGKGRVPGTISRYLTGVKCYQQPKSEISGRKKQKDESPAHIK